MAHNALRQSNTSYWLGLDEDAPALQQRMGQRSSNVLFDAYAKRVEKKEVEAFWLIRAGEERIVDIEAA